jgi:pyridoxal phosphate enzyme (YggS family)
MKSIKGCSKNSDFGILIKTDTAHNYSSTEYPILKFKTRNTLIQEELTKIREELPAGVRLVAISKYHPVSAIEEAYTFGQRIFGENHVQELMEKESVLPKDIEWHFTGHLQTNKVKYIAPFISLIHAVDTEKLLREIDKQGKKCTRRIPCLLQLHIAKEQTKYGFAPEELEAFLQSGVHKELENADIRGLMCMATFTDDVSQIEDEFSLAQSIFRQTKERYFSDSQNFTELSMGMSDDYPIAVRHGATLVRIGTRIFGERQY